MIKVYLYHRASSYLSCIFNRLNKKALFLNTLFSFQHYYMLITVQEGLLFSKLVLHRACEDGMEVHTTHDLKCYLDLLLY